MSCCVADCERPVSYLGRCATHFRRPSPRLPLSPLRARVESNVALARYLGVPRRYVFRWQRDGITIHSAEKVCDAAELHPMEVWGDAYLYAVSCPVAKLAAAVVV